MKITYAKDLTSLVLDAFDKAVDDDHYLVEKKDRSQRVLTPDGNQIPVNMFGGVKKGSELYVSNDIVSIMNLCRHLDEQEK